MSPLARSTIFLSLGYAALGAVLPYLPVWLKEAKGLSGSQIGLLMASAAFARIFVGPFAGAWIEGQPTHRRPLMVFACLALTGFSAMAMADGFWALLPLGVATICAYQTLMPLNEALIQRASVGSRRLPYGRARAVGSAVFVLANLGAGALLQWHGEWAAYGWVLVSVGVMAGFSFVMPREERPPRQKQDFARRLAGAMALLRTPNIMPMVLAAAAIQASHSFYYTFSSNLWLEQGVSPSLVGLLWGTGVVAEIALLALVAPRLERVRPVTLIALGGALGAIRWSAMAFAPPFAASLALQCLHAASFGLTLIGAMRAIQAAFGDDKGPLAQTILSSMVFAPAVGIVTLLAGPAYDTQGALGYLLGTVSAVVGLALLVLTRRARA